ncbi:PREDICTED: histamine H4 receptor isoform X2 [Hipposideros armiger]|uniref:Histamine H4 receptor isoform X2 n=1 Tax=Hipposideros armiger TaxID=186990 RepID=A0A8B7SGF1_HIPAR|nr:PREDICTED: histamine H4 receptor isoform X2 [Hipposideros armiger]
MSATNSTTTLSQSTCITLAFLMGLLAFAIMLGNAIVILAFVVDKNLRHRSNYFFLNLAISDFFVVSDSWKRDREHCEAGFISKWYILAITSFFEFLAPVFLVAYFNIYIYWRLWKRGHLSRWQSHPGLTSSTCSSNSERTFKYGLFSRASLAEPKEAAVSLHFKRRERKSSLLFSIRTQKNSDIIASKMGSLSHAESLALHQREHLELLKARKLAKSLAILLGVFTICWGPYSLFTFVLSFYDQNRRPQKVLYEITFVLQWCNSFVNPFLYPLCHKRFQKAFLKIFCMKKQPILPHNQPVSA